MAGVLPPERRRSHMAMKTGSRYRCPGDFAQQGLQSLHELVDTGAVKTWIRAAIFFSAATTVSGAFGGFLADFPDTAKFLNEAERTVVIRRLQSDDQFSAAGEALKWKYIWKSLLDWKTWIGKNFGKMIQGYPRESANGSGIFLRLLHNRTDTVIEDISTCKVRAVAGFQLTTFANPIRRAWLSASSFCRMVNAKKCWPVSRWRPYPFVSEQKLVHRRSTRPKDALRNQFASLPNTDFIFIQKLRNQFASISSTIWRIQLKVAHHFWIIVLSNTSTLYHRNRSITGIHQSSELLSRSPKVRPVKGEIQAWLFTDKWILRQAVRPYLTDELY
ncbi:hypothetical protein B0H14DRAFT_3171076 [Mycena olivaceomarginata]|nr:hypothetical protein B0H14DRAFT_3171076 [Mycena olivaceomarginata]